MADFYKAMEHDGIAARRSIADGPDKDVETKTSGKSPYYWAGFFKSRVSGSKVSRFWRWVARTRVDLCYLP